MHYQVFVVKQVLLLKQTGRKRYRRKKRREKDGKRGEGRREEMHPWGNVRLWMSEA